ncbi:hypothetical protein Rsub_03938 [Raphidocelis subcapitata]|uniref:Conserved oligomeric Golgi complex subunit 5 n=1 Tax=Raphidocelis subcapitata TaxID=307507 RepID=A0A2V0NWM7_9CHLO|nr:hypothetical protein Rsub_03938 [Raphidocelis subcapitata]|eukprot:GBF91082.1 hypothetical protein Rsub_03938 [Raphidocelis subcapitata]
MATSDALSASIGATPPAMQQQQQALGGANGAAGAPSAPAAAAPDALLALPQFAPFLGGEFDAAEFTSRVLAESRTTAHAQAEELRQGVRQLEGALAAGVVARHAELLGHARRLLDAEAGAAEVALSVGSLQAAVRRVRAEVEGPYDAVRLKTRQLRALHASIELLRALLARLKLVSKLRQQLEAPPEQLDLAKAARLLADVAAASGGGVLAGVDAAAADEPFLAAAGARIREAAQAALAEGMDAMSQAKVGGALQVFFNLGELGPAVEAVIARHVAELDRAARAALDSRHLSLSVGAAGRGAGTAPGGARGLALPQPGAAGSWQEKLWQGLKSVADALVAGGVAVWHLQRVAAKKRDPLSNTLLLDELTAGGGTSLTDRYWSEALRVLGDAFGAAAKPAKGGFVREALSGGYPKLVAALEAAFERLQQDTRVRGMLPAVAADQLPALLAVASPFRDAYLAAALGRLQDVVGAAYGGGARGLPSPADVQKCIAAMHDELRAVGGSPMLAGQVAGVVGTALKLIAQRAEYAAATGPELRAVTLSPSAGGATAAQLRNIALASQLQEIHRSLVTLLPRLPQQVAAALDSPLSALQAAALDAVAPIFRGLVEAVEARLVGMHAAHWSHWGGGELQAAAAMMDTSGYVAEVAAALGFFRSEYIARFSPTPTPSAPSAVATLCERAAGRVLTFFVRHAALLRPLPPPAKLQLAKDLVELQAGVGQSLWPLEALGPAVRCLRGFRALLFVEDAALDTGAAPVRDLPSGIALHHLFSRLPASIQSPHERSGLTPAQYSKWLDQHDLADVARGVAAALEAAQPAAAALDDPAQRTVLLVMQQLSAAAAGNGVGAAAGHTRR